MPKRTTLVSAILVSAVSTLLPASALAAGFATARFGGEHGHPLATNATAIYYNPAALTQDEGYHIFLDGNIAFRSLSYSRTDAADASNNGEGTLSNVAAAPMLGATAKFGNLALGLGAYVPFGGTGVWDKADAWENNAQNPGAYDGAQRWYAIEGTIQSTFVTLAAAYEIPKTGLSLGLSGNLILSKINTVRARNGDGSDEPSTEGRSLVDVKNTAASLGLGLMYEAIEDRVWLGFSYQSRPNFSDDIKYTGKLESTSPLPSGDIDIHSALPDIFRFGTRFLLTPKLETRVFGDYTRWSVLTRMCLVEADTECKLKDDGSGAVPTTLQNQPRDWRDTFGVRAGVSYWFSGKPEYLERPGRKQHQHGGDGSNKHGKQGAPKEREIEGVLGLGYDSSAVPDASLEPALPDFDKGTVSLGARVGFGAHLHAALSYTQIFYTSRDTTGKSTADQYLGASQNPNSGGTYSQSIGVINANIDVNF